MNRKTSCHLLMALLPFVWAARAGAEDYDFNGRERERAIIFSGRECHIKSNGEADISGFYDDPEGVLEIRTDGFSSLKITGACRKLIVTSMNGLSVADLSGLRIGSEGVLVQEMNGLSLLNLQTEQAIKVHSIAGVSELHYAKTAVAPRITVDKIAGAAKIVEGLRNMRAAIGERRGARGGRTQDRRAVRCMVGGDMQKAYWLISPDLLVAPLTAQTSVNATVRSTPPSRSPTSGLIVVLEEGNPEDVDRREFWKEAAVRAFGGRYRIALVVRPKWTSDSAGWVIRSNRAQTPGAAFTTEDFAAEVVGDVAAQVSIDSARIYLHGEGTAGLAAYACSLEKNTPFRGAYMLSSPFRAAQLPLAPAKGRHYVIQHSKRDRGSPYVLAAAAGEILRKQGAIVQFSTVTGEHGYQFDGDVWEPLHAAVAWLELQK